MVHGCFEVVLLLLFIRWVGLSSLKLPIKERKELLSIERGEDPESIEFQFETDKRSDA